MKQKVAYYLDDLIKRYPILSACKKSIEEAFSELKKCFSSGNKLLIAGNGGSYADAEHIAGELMKEFKIKRSHSSSFINKINNIDKEKGNVMLQKIQPGFPTIVLGNHQGLTTAFLNDISDGGLYVFSQQMYVYGKANDVFLAISTSGKSKNILNACIVARALGIKIISLTGETGGDLDKISDVCIKAPRNETFLIQELHLPIYHCLCLMLEEEFFGNNNFLN